MRGVYVGMEKGTDLPFDRMADGSIRFHRSMSMDNWDYIQEFTGINVLPSVEVHDWGSVAARTHFTGAFLPD